MSYSTTRVTLELRDVLASYDENGEPFELWDFDYPSFYKGEAKKAFEQKVIDHYLFRQIGAETPARFKHNFKTRVREVMPYYVQLYESEKFMQDIDDPFATVDVTETFVQDTHDTSKGSASSTETTDRTDTKNGSENATHRFSNTPQGAIENIDDYLTEAAKDDKTANESVKTDGSVKNVGSSDTENTGKTTYTLTKKGAMGVTTFGHDMIEYRQSFLNIDQMVIESLNNVFLLIY